MSLEKARIAIQHRGYVVCSFDACYKVGDIIETLRAATKNETHRTVPVHHPFVIIAETDIEDLMEQRRLLGIPLTAHFQKHLYRLMAD